MSDTTGKPRKPRQPKAPAEATAPKPSTEEVLAKRRGTQRPFPAAPFEEAMMLANDLLRVGSGQPVRRLTLFNDIGKAPESGASRMLITNANRYGLVSGGYQAEHLELTPDGLKAVDDATPPREQARVRVRLAIENVDPFTQLYDRLKGTKLPSRAVLVGDSIPFDVGQMRTVRVDNSTIYSLVPKIETYQSEIASQVRRALESEAEIDTPISTYFPGFRVSIDGAA
jgi:hypothetical protein